VSDPVEARRLPEGLMVLDASFLLALLDGEAAAQRFTSVLARGVAPAVTAGEAFYKLHTAAGVDPTQVEDGLLALGVELVDLPVAAARHFPALKALDTVRRDQPRNSGKRPVQTLSLGDLCCLGYAAAAGLPVLTGDRHWITLQPLGLGVDVYNFRDPTNTP